MLYEYHPRTRVCGGGGVLWVVVVVVVGVCVVIYFTQMTEFTNQVSSAHFFFIIDQRQTV